MVIVLDEVLAFIGRWWEYIMVGIFLIIVGLVMKDYWQKIKKLSKFSITSIKKILLKLKNIFSVPFLIEDKERKRRAMHIFRKGNLEVVEVYYKPPFTWVFKKILFITSLFFIVLLVVIYFINIIWLIPISLVFLFFVLFIIRKSKQQKQELKNGFYTKEGIPFVKKGNQFIYPR